MDNARPTLRILLLAALALLAAAAPAAPDGAADIERIDDLLARGAAAEALACAESLLTSPDLAPRNIWRVRQRMGAALLALGRVREAVPVLEAAAEVAGDEPTLHLNLARAWRALGQPGRAVGSFQRALTLAPDRPSWRLEFGEVLLELGAVGDAEREIAVARDLCGDCPPALLAAANLALRTGDHRGAIGPLRDLLAHGHGQPVRSLLVASLWNAGEAAGAAAVLDTIAGASLTPEEAMVAAQVERALGRCDRARAWTRRPADDLPPGWTPPATFWAFLAEACLGVDEPAVALAAIDHALELEPAVAIYHNNRAAALAALGRDAEARAALAEARRLGPEPGGSP